jgi:hypothetical protein
MVGIRYAILALGVLIVIASFTVYPGWETRIVGFVFIAMGLVIPYLKPSHAKPRPPADDVRPLTSEDYPDEKRRRRP